jgi:hypothetical protein
MSNITRHILLILFSFQTMTTNAQSDKFDTLQNALMFNIYSGAPDSIVFPFLKNHFPYLTKKAEPGGWTIYPPGPQPIPLQGMHSLKIDHHPFIKHKHSGAQLDVLTQEWQEGSPGIERVRIWIYFPDMQDAKTACDSIVTEFRNTGAYIENITKKKIERINIRKNANDEYAGSLSLLIKKIPNLNKYAIWILFYDDDGSSW